MLHNWDFHRYPVSERAEKFLLEIQDHPLLDMKAVNPRLYVVADEMAILQVSSLMFIFLLFLDIVIFFVFYCVIA